MANYLLLGAGFSRNWGGWLATEAFEYLLGRQEIADNEPLRALLWKSQACGGFENALADLQMTSKSGDKAAVKNLADLQIAVSAMFDTMNAGYFAITRFEFNNLRERLIAVFLARFDAIFSLNQDVLLEHHYLSNEPAFHNKYKWDGVTMPGVRPIMSAGINGSISWGQLQYTPIPESQFVVPKRQQPLFKLHGSSNWREADDSSMLVIGGNKTQAIGGSPILKWYQDEFIKRLSEGDARLMVIGYGFRDEHINKILVDAIKDNKLKLFVIAPEGADIARAVSPTANAAIKAQNTPLQDAFERGLIGASRRGLREIFTSDEVEFTKVMRFFDG